MSELKTLKDIRLEHWDGVGYWLEEEDVKQEAIKWVKSNELSVRTDKWIKHFFNLTEEDLK